MLTGFEYRILKWLRPCHRAEWDQSRFQGESKIRLLLGDDFLTRVRDKTVIDFGCGEGEEAVAIARHGARQVVGLDIRPELLTRARQRAREAGVARICHFAVETDQKADVILSLDAFEHFANPSDILRQMQARLNPGGEVAVSFGPTWYHPLGGHLFSVFPWAHLVFSEVALIRWRSDFKSDGAGRFQEVAGGLNLMTIGRFVKLVQESPLEFAALETVPIRKLRRLHNRLTREFTTAVVRCRLTRRCTAPQAEMAPGFELALPAFSPEAAQYSSPVCRLSG